MSPALPAAGSPLSDENGTTFAVVVERGWNDLRIRTEGRRHTGVDYEPRSYELMTWRSFLSDQKRDIGWPLDEDYWGIEGAGRRRIDVAVWRADR